MCLERWYYLVPLAVLGGLADLVRICVFGGLVITLGAYWYRHKDKNTLDTQLVAQAMLP